MKEPFGGEEKKRKSERKKEKRFLLPLNLTHFTFAYGKFRVMARLSLWKRHFPFPGHLIATPAASLPYTSCHAGRVDYLKLKC